MADNKSHVTAGIVPIDNSTGATAKTFYVTAGIVPNDVAAATKGEGKFTRLSPCALPGKISSFLAKDPWDPDTERPEGGPYTDQSVTATPGRPHSFSAKDIWEPNVPRPDNGPYTDQSVTATPGKRRNFSGKGDIFRGPFTRLSVVALPGKRYAIVAKTETEIIAEIVTEEELMAPPDRYTLDKVRFIEQIRREDDEILAIILATAASGILDE